MPLQNDASIGDNAVLLRVLHDNWIYRDGERRRPTKQAFMDGNTGEVSCFIDGPGVREEIRRMFPGREIAAVRAQVVRDSGFVIERRPADCGNFRGAPDSHVVIGPPVQLRRLECERCAHRIAVHPDVILVARAPIE